MGVLPSMQTGQPVCVLLGGRFGDDYPLYRAIRSAVHASIPSVVSLHAKTPPNGVSYTVRTDEGVPVSNDTAVPILFAVL